MKVLFVGTVTVIAGILLFTKREYKKQIIAGFLSVIVLFCAYYDYAVLKLMPDVSFHRPFSQTFYQKEFIDTGEFPDSLLPLLLSKKTVYTKNDPMDFEDAEAMGKNWMYGFYHQTNIVNYLNLIEAYQINDEGMNGTMLTGARIEEDFYKLGPANDMLRYSFICTDFREELGNSFNYFWYYSDHLSEIDVYLNIKPDINGQDIASADDLVLLWDSPEGAVEEENLYIMTKAYYEENVR